MNNQRWRLSVSEAGGLVSLLICLMVWSLAACAPSGSGATEAVSTPNPQAGAALTPTVSAAKADESSEPYASQTNGAVQVMSVNGNSPEYFWVLQDGKPAFDGAPPLLNTVLEVPPGTYTVEVNRTQREVTVEPREKVVLWTGDLVVRGDETGPFWYPKQGSETRLAANPPLLDTPRSLFPGTYTVFVHVGVGVPDTNLGEVEVKPGETTVLQH